MLVQKLAVVVSVFLNLGGWTSTALGAEPGAAGAPPDFSAMTAEVQLLLQNSAPRKEVIHCLENKATCRKLILLKDKASGLALKDFYMVFSSIERQVGATEYFLANSDGTFHSYLDDTFDSVVRIDFYNEKNANLRVTVDAEGFPTIYDTHLVRHGSTQYAIADLSFSSGDSQLVGTQYDSADPSFRQKIAITYKRNLTLETK